jgi:hypothetical protein
MRALTAMEPLLFSWRWRDERWGDGAGKKRRKVERVKKKKKKKIEERPE